MKALLLKEFKTIFSPSLGVFFPIAFLLLTGLLLWFLPGKYNVIDSGYANLDSFFSLSPIILAILIPALTMRQFAEEKRNKTFDILLVRPVSIVSIYTSKYLATYLFIFVTLLSTTCYVYTLSVLSNPIGNIDAVGIFASYCSLLILVGVFTTIGLFCSVISNNQIAAFILAVFACLFSFYGFELLAQLFMSGKLQSNISSMGLYKHYELMQRGVVQIKDLLVIFNYLCLFFGLAMLFLHSNKTRIAFIVANTLIAVNVLFFFIPNLRIDFTADKRYTLNDYTKNVLKKISEKDKKFKVDIYLSGNLNPGFQRLQDATTEIVTDFNRYSSNAFSLNYEVIENKDGDNNATAENMSQRGMPPILLSEVDREGKMSKQLVYPYAQLISGTDTLTISLLKNISGYTADENINASIEDLEFQFVDALYLLKQTEPKNIAFIEGHKELPRTEVYDAEEVLSKYYTVNRGQIIDQVGVLDGFTAIIIAGTSDKFTEAEKYIIDQYIMSGGKVLWLIDGVYYSNAELAQNAKSASIKNDVNLDDMLFTYGVRISPSLIQDKQSTSIYLTSGQDDRPSSVLVPCFYIPLLIPSPDNPITKNIRDVRASFISPIEIVNNSPLIEKHILLTSSANTHIVNVPDMIDLDVESIQNNTNYFDQAYIPVACSLEGNFTSVFTNRMIPVGVDTQNKQPIYTGSKSRMIVVGGSNVIANEIEGQGENSQVLPMGYDRVMRRQFGNRDFIINSLNWLTDGDDRMSIRNKTQKLYTLNKEKSYTNRTMYAIINILCPIAFMLILVAMVSLYRKCRYARH